MSLLGVTLLGQTGLQTGLRTSLLGQTGLLGPTLLRLWQTILKWIDPLELMFLEQVYLDKSFLK